MKSSPDGGPDVSMKWCAPGPRSTLFTSVGSFIVIITIAQHHVVVTAQRSQLPFLQLWFKALCLFLLLFNKFAKSKVTASVPYHQHTNDPTCQTLEFLPLPQYCTVKSLQVISDWITHHRIKWNRIILESYFFFYYLPFSLKNVIPWSSLYIHSFPSFHWVHIQHFIIPPLLLLTWRFFSMLLTYQQSWGYLFLPYCLRIPGSELLHPGPVWVSRRQLGQSWVPH